MTYQNISVKKREKAQDSWDSEFFMLGISDYSFN